MDEPLNKEIVPIESLQPPAVTIPEPPKEKEIAYTINDVSFSGFEVQKSANAWWTERTKVSELIGAFKNGHTVKGACIKAGITERQYKYFVEIHPEFRTIKDICEEVNLMLIETGLTHHLKKATPAVLMWAAERRLSGKYGKHLAEGAGPVINNNFGTVINVKPETAERIRERRQQAQNGQP